MKLPNFDNVIIPPRKLTDYLLSFTHPEGCHKAIFFHCFGFKIELVEHFEEALRQHVRDHDVSNVEHSQYGIRYAVDGELLSPNGRNPCVRTVWFISWGEDRPKFVTAYPIRRSLS